MALMGFWQRQGAARAKRRAFRAIFFCVIFAIGLTSCSILPVREKAQIAEPEKTQVPEPEKPPIAPIVEPEKPTPDPRELIAKAANVTEFTKLIYPEETSGLKTPADKLKITVKPQSPESARKEIQSYYAAYCETRNGQLITGLPTSRIPDNLPAHIKSPYSQKLKKKYDLSPSVQWCQDKEDVYFGLEVGDRAEGANGHESTVTVYTESFVEKNRLWTSQKDMISKLEKEIEKDKQELIYSVGIIDIPTIMLIAKVSRPDAEGHQHLELSIENRGRTRMQIRTDANKFVTRDGKSYNVLWGGNKNGASIKVSGEGCQLTDKNTLFLVNPGSKCTLSAPISLPGVSQQPPDGMITFDLFTFDMRRVSAYEDKTSARSSR